MRYLEEGDVAVTAAVVAVGIIQLLEDRETQKNAGPIVQLG
ncbi:MAG TPA: hypothetical protein VN239_04375 [Nitrososphaera sp.]|nr:hypothetical protein [Nitrososphaera sp.]